MPFLGKPDGTPRRNAFSIQGLQPELPELARSFGQPAGALAVGADPAAPSSRHGGMEGGGVERSKGGRWAEEDEEGLLIRCVGCSC